MKKLFYIIFAILILNNIIVAQTTSLISDSSHQIMMNDFTKNINSILQIECPEGLNIDQFKKKIIKGELTLSISGQQAIANYATHLKEYGLQFIASNPSLEAPTNSYVFFFASFVPSTRIDNKYYPGRLLENEVSEGLKANEIWSCAMQSFNTDICATQTVVQDKKNLNLLANYCVKKLTEIAGETGILVMLSGFSDCISMSRYKITKGLNYTDLIKNDLVKKKMEILSGKSLDTITNYVSIDSLGFSVDVNDYLYISNGREQTYTFKINRYESNEYLENLIFKSTVEGSFDIIIAKYNKIIMNTTFKTEEEFLASIKDNVIFSNLINNKIGIHPCVVVESTWTLVPGHPCAGENHHDYYDVDCPLWGTDEGATLDEYVLSMHNTPCPEGGGSGPDFSTSPYEGTHGGGGSATINLLLKNPCKTIQKQMTNYPQLKQSLVDLSTTISQNHENGIFIDDSATATTALTTNPIQTIPTSNNVGGSVNINQNPTQKYVIIAHTHDTSGSDGNGTFSIFSWGDLLAIAELIRKDKIDTTNFVFFVATADGTRYAMTIDSPQQFAEYFDIRADKTLPSSNINTDWNKAIELDAKQNIYYNNEPKVNTITKSSNPADDKVLFLNLMNDIGSNISLFEADSTFTNFSNLTLNNNGILYSKPCNN